MGNQLLVLTKGEIRIKALSLGRAQGTSVMIKRILSVDHRGLLHRVVHLHRHADSPAKITRLGASVLRMRSIRATATIMALGHSFDHISDRGSLRRACVSHYSSVSNIFLSSSLHACMESLRCAYQLGVQRCAFTVGEGACPLAATIRFESTFLFLLQR